jgi:hypothetical protein
VARATDDISHRWRESGFQADKVHATIFEQIERFDEIGSASAPADGARFSHAILAGACVCQRSVEEMVLLIARWSASLHPRAASSLSRSTLVSITQIILIQTILIRKNVFVKRKIGNLFETKADYGKQSKIGEVFSDDGKW